MLKRFIIFDLDGVLLDSRPNMEIAWQAVRSQLGIEVPFDDYFEQIGKPFSEILSILGLAKQVDEIEPIFRTTSMENMQNANFYPNVESTLAQLAGAGIPMGVVTSKDKLRTSAVLARLPIEFNTINTPNARYRGKPAPDHLLVAMAEAGVDPADTVFVGDMDSDYEAAQRAGISYAHAGWGYGAVPTGNVAVLNTFPDTLKLMEIP